MSPCIHGGCFAVGLSQDKGTPAAEGGGSGFWDKETQVNGANSKALRVQEGACERVVTRGHQRGRKEDTAS